MGLAFSPRQTCCRESAINIRPLLGIESCDSPNPGSLPQGEWNVWTDEGPLFIRGSGWRLDPTLVSLLQKSEMEFRHQCLLGCSGLCSSGCDPESHCLGLTPVWSEQAVCLA